MSFWVEIGCRKVKNETAGVKWSQKL